MEGEENRLGVPYHGLANIYISIHQSHSEVRDATLLQEIYSAFPKVLEIILKRFPFFDTLWQDQRLEKAHRLQIPSIVHP